MVARIAGSAHHACGRLAAPIRRLHFRPALNHFRIRAKQTQSAVTRCCRAIFLNSALRRCTGMATPAGDPAQCEKFFANQNTGDLQAEYRKTS